jgi:hypothetical protein
MTFIGFSEETKIVLGVLTLIIVALVQAARRWPHIRWLRHFLPAELSPERRRQFQRRGNRQAGIELILTGLVLPMGYVAMTMMMFNDFDPLWTAVVAVASLACLALGITAIVKNWT